MFYYYIFCISDVPNREIIPQVTQTTMFIPTEPEYCKAEAGETNIPEPIMTASIRFMAENKPSSLLSCMPPPFSSRGTFSLSVISIKKIN